MNERTGKADVHMHIETYNTIRQYITISKSAESMHRLKRPTRNSFVKACID